MSDNQLRDLQLIELDILKEVDRICKKNNIEYFLDSGTALGAIRHKGFIPWDDDIDIGMIRENYERFLAIAPNELNNDFFLQIRDTDKNSPYYFAKVRKNNTIFMEWNKRNIDMHHGVYIDIFPYDNLPDDKVEKEKFQKRCKDLYRLYVIKTTPDRDVSPKKSINWFILAFIRRLMHITLKLIPFIFIKKIVDKTFTKYNNSDTEYITCLFYSKNCSFKKEELFPLREVQFENESFFIFKNSDYYLKELYGDYLELPPENERVGHLPFKLKY